MQQDKPTVFSLSVFVWLKAFLVHEKKGGLASIRKTQKPKTASEAHHRGRALEATCRSCMMIPKLGIEAFELGGGGLRDWLPLKLRMTAQTFRR